MDSLGFYYISVPSDQPQFLHLRVQKRSSWIWVVLPSKSVLPHSGHLLNGNGALLLSSSDGLPSK